MDQLGSIGTRTHIGLSSAGMISTGRRWVTGGAAGCAGTVPSCLLHVQAEKAGMARKVITRRGAALVRSGLMGEVYQIYKNNQDFRNIF